MSASDEYRLFALTIPASDIIHRLALAEDVRVMLVWLETQGYGDVVDHIDDAFEFPTCAADINSSIVAPRLGWLLKQVALEPELAYLTWPPRDHEWLAQVTALTFAEHRNGLARSSAEMTVDTLINTAWKALLEQAGVRARTVGTTPMLHALNTLRLLPHTRPLWNRPGFFREYVTAGTQSTCDLPATSLHWRL